MDWDAFVRLAFEEIRLVGAGSPQVSRRLQAALDDLERVVPPTSRVLDEQRVLLTRAFARVFEDTDVRLALLPDRLGLGVDAS